VRDVCFDSRYVGRFGRGRGFVRHRSVSVVRLFSVGLGRIGFRPTPPVSSCVLRAT
jgi:hypothetical protein